MKLKWNSGEGEKGKEDMEILLKYITWMIEYI